MNVVITGASGFIGKHIINSLKKRNCKIWVISRAPSKIDHLTNSQVIYTDYSLQGLVEIFKNLSNHIKEGVFFIHNAGIKFSHNKRDYYNVNYGITKNIIDALNITSFNVRKFVFMSSISAVGPYFNNEERINDLKYPQPISHYGKSKLLAEVYCLENSTFPLLILRPTAVYGEYDKDFLYLFRLVKKGVVFIPTREQQWVSFIYVKDLSEIIVKALFENDVIGTFCVSDGRDYLLLDFLLLIQEVLQKSCYVVKLPYLLSLMSGFFIGGLSKIFRFSNYLSYERIKELGAKNWKCDPSRILSLLSYSPLSIYHGIPLTIHWYLMEGLL